MDEIENNEADLLGSLKEVKQQAAEISEELRISNERNSVNEKVLQRQKTTLQLLAVGSVAMFIMVILMFVMIVDARNTFHLLKDCLTPKGDCAQTLGKRSTIVQQIFLKRIEDDRLSTQVDAAKASANAGSPTARATVEVYEKRREAIAAEIDVLNKQLNALDPTEG